MGVYGTVHSCYHKATIAKKNNKERQHNHLQAQTLRNGRGLVIFPLLFFGLTLPLIIEGAPVPLEQLLGLATFWLLCIALTVVPLGARLEVGEDYIKSYLFGFTTTPKIHRSDVDQIRYENLTAWGISLGKGIKIWRKDAGRSQFSIKPKWAFDASIGESAYGKEAIDHARRVLSSGNQD
jgi:hypothetical protein